MTESTANNFKVGFVYFTFLIILMVATVTFGKLDFWKKTYHLRVEFKNVGGLKDGDPVRVSGLELGRVDRLELHPGGVLVSLKMHGPIDLRENYQIAVTMSSLVGGRHVAIEAGDADRPSIDATAILHGEPPSSAIDEMGEILKENRKAVREFIANLNDISDSLKNGKGTLGRLLKDDTLYTQVTDTVSEVRGAVAELKKAGEVIGKVKDQLDKGEGTLAKLLMSNDVYDSLKASADRISSILAKAERGEGTLGKILNDPSMYDEARELVAQMKDAVASVQKVVDKINNGEGTAGKLLNDEKLAQDLMDTVAQAKEVAGSIKNITEKIDKGQGTIGKLINESGLYDQAESALGSLDKTLGAATRVKTYVTIGSRYYINTKLFAPYGALRVYPNEDRYIEFGAVGWPASTSTPWDYPEKDKHDKGKFFINYTGLLGFTFMDGRLDVAGGLLEGKLGIRAGYRFTIPKLDHDVSVVAEVRGPFDDKDKLDERTGAVMARIYLDTKVWRWFHVQAGVSSLARHPEFFAGASFTYEDEDIRTFISLIGLAK
ncbi:MAG: MlaD family protein [Planctomycetes bacterium]|nr:MlaD family protein [Planctomycetota bacterium]